MSPQMDDAAIGRAFRAYLAAWTKGGREALREMYEEIIDADRLHFPAEPALIALAKVERWRLSRALDDEELEELRDEAAARGLATVAKHFERAAIEAPVLDNGRVPKAIREAVFAKAGGRCQYCGSAEDLTIDHKITPWIEGGSSRDLKNLQLLCRSCNSRKGARPMPVAPGPAKPRPSKSARRRSR